MSKTVDLSLELLAWRNSVKFYHWNTFSYARHVATCSFVAAMDTFVDSVIEKYIARYGRPTITNVVTIPVMPIVDNDAIAMMKQLANFLQKEFPKFVKASDTDLLNLRDDMLGTVHNTIYLFTLE